MTEYEIGRQARREGEPLQANPYWGCSGEQPGRGWPRRASARRFDYSGAATSPPFVNAHAGLGVRAKLSPWILHLRSQATHVRPCQKRQTP